MSSHNAPIGSQNRMTSGDLSRYLSFESLAELNWVVRGLFGLRQWLGGVLGGRVWRSERDSNPRALPGVRVSSAVQSASLPSLRG